MPRETLRKEGPFMQERTREREREREGVKKVRFRGHIWIL